MAFSCAIIFAIPHSTENKVNCPIFDTTPRYFFLCGYTSGAVLEDNSDSFPYAK
jgi:hypothetical protein